MQKPWESPRVRFYVEVSALAVAVVAMVAALASIPTRAQRLTPPPPPPLFQLPRTDSLGVGQQPNAVEASALLLLSLNAKPSRFVTVRVASVGPFKTQQAAFAKIRSFVKYAPAQASGSVWGVSWTEAGGDYSYYADFSGLRSAAVVSDFCNTLVSEKLLCRQSQIKANYEIQAGAFRSVDGAARATGEYEGLDARLAGASTSRIERISKDGVLLYRSIFAGIVDIDTAKSICAVFKASHRGCFVRERVEKLAAGLRQTPAVTDGAGSLYSPNTD